MENFNRNSMTAKLSFVVLLIIILVTTILIGSIWASGVIDALAENSYISFNKNTETHKSFIKDQMILGFGNILSFAYDIVEIHEDIVQSNDQLAYEDISLFLQTSVLVVVDMLNSSFTTGTFLILDNDDGTGQYSALYLKDSDQLSIHKSREEILILSAPAEVADVFNPSLQLHSHWKPKPTLNENNRDILDAPIRRALKNVATGNMRNSGR